MTNSLPVLGTQSQFHRFVREERLFCTVVAHLLMQRGSNLAAFLSLVQSKQQDVEAGLARAFDRSVLDEAQIYVEFSFLRDYWDRLERDNDAKMAHIQQWLARVPGLHQHADSIFGAPIPLFNAYFMGARGSRIREDIVYPGQWSVDALATTLESQPDVFRTFCKFKWAFNIKPDLVVLLPDSMPLCIEAKLESREGHYPVKQSECKKFDDLFGKQKERVYQRELQTFLFEVLLGSRCRHVSITRSGNSGSSTGAPGEPNTVFLSWEEVFREMDLSHSVPHVRALLENNKHLFRETGV